MNKKTWSYHTDPLSVTNYTRSSQTFWIYINQLEILGAGVLESINRQFKEFFHHGEISLRICAPVPNTTRKPVNVTYKQYSSLSQHSSVTYVNLSAEQHCRHLWQQIGLTCEASSLINPEILCNIHQWIVCLQPVYWITVYRKFASDRCLYSHSSA